MQKRSCGARCIGNKIFPAWQKSQLECDGFCLLILEGERKGTMDIGVQTLLPYDWGLSQFCDSASLTAENHFSNIYCGFSVILIFQHLPN